MKAGSFCLWLLASLAATGLSGGDRAAAQSMPCNDVQEICQAIMGPPCLQTLGAGSVAAGDDATASACRLAATAFRLCLEKIAGACNPDASNAGAARAASAPDARPQHSALGPQRTRNGDLAELVSCAAEGHSLTCRLRLVPGSDQRIDICGVHFEAVFPNGEAGQPAQYRAGAHRDECPYFNVYRDVPVPIELVFDSPVPLAPGDTLPILGWTDAEAVFRGVPVE